MPRISGQHPVILRRAITASWRVKENLQMKGCHIKLLSLRINCGSIAELLPVIGSACKL